MAVIASSAASSWFGSVDQSKWPSDDRSMCNYRNNIELEVNETAGPGAIRPNVRRVYKVFGGNNGEARRKTLVCREVDTNLDGPPDQAVLRVDVPAAEMAAQTDAAQ